MSLRRGLIGLSIFIFLLSGIGLVTLAIDEQRDLSSRAATVQSQLQTTPDELTLMPNESIWDGSPLGLPSIEFNHALWQAPQNSDTVFIHRFNQISVRIGKSTDINQSKLPSLLGRDFSLRKNIGVISTGLSSWKARGYIYNFFGKEKSIYLLEDPTGVSVLVVSPLNAPTTDIESLISGLIKPPSVKGASTLDDSAKLAALVRPSVVMIATSYCANVQIGSLQGTAISDKNYPFCLAATGSGFFINDQGYIATNGHVVKITDNSAVVAAVTTGQVDDLLVDFTQDYLRQTGTNLSREAAAQRVTESKSKKESLLQLAGALISLKEANLLKIESGKTRYFVQAGATPLTLSQAGVNLGKDILEAQLIDYDYREVDQVKGFSSSDVAILKIGGSNYPSLPLGDLKDVIVGSSVQAFGFPGVVSGTHSLLLDSSSIAEPTVTRGVISAIKKAKGDQRTLIQTDASINHGNSGGPGIDSQGRVIGIATYGIIPEEGSGNYNFLRDVADLKILMQKNNIANTVGDTYKFWKQGLESYWLSFYEYAQADLGKVKELYPIHPTVDKYLNEIQTKVGTPEDITPLIPRSQRRQLMIISGTVMALSLFSSIIFYFQGNLTPKQVPTFPEPTPTAPIV